MLAWLYDALLGADHALSGSTLLVWRAAAAFLLALVVVLLAGPRTIVWLRARVLDQNNSPSARLRELHAAKSLTPTMGGLLVLVAIALAMLLLGDLTNHYVQIGLLLLIGMGIVGVLDDLKKVVTGRGESPRAKLIGQTLVAIPVALAVYAQQAHAGGSLACFVPLVGSVGTLGVWFVPLAVLVLVGSCNSVNLTDGLDGLAAGCLLAALAVLAIVVGICGDVEWAAHWGIPAIAGAGETLVLTAAAIGGVLGFLWFNRHPARIFLGDTGSLSLGALLGYLAIVSRQEVLVAIVCGVFVVETLSVAVQLASLRWRGRRVFLCAPLHHHFQFRGWSETRVVGHFWLAALTCAALGGIVFFVSGIAIGRHDELRTAAKLAERAESTSPSSSIRQ
ncbi:MAG: phospho-N-acetylmuramoyl-pentapeptide-transferase [Pirellulales bacterium]|nr:phospho-N-acetylmuramoyl-pentapeptide-transferase [Pirellulales bacterium]